MNLSVRDMKLLSKRHLKKRMPQIILVSSVVLIIMFTISYFISFLLARSQSLTLMIMNLVIAFILYLFFQVFLTGYLHFLLQSIADKEVHPRQLLYGFTSCPDKIITLSFLTFLFQNIWTVPGIVCYALYYTTGRRYELLAALCALFLLIGLCIGLYFMMLYSQTLFLIADCPSMSIKNALQSSRNVMKGNKSSLFYLYLSFVGYFLLGIFTLYLGFFLIMPYLYLALTYFYLNVTQQIIRAEIS